MDQILNAFTRHPRSVGESYWAHMGMALSFAGTLALAMLACLVHAVLPFACESTGSRLVRRLHARLEARGSSPKA